MGRIMMEDYDKKDIVAPKVKKEFKLPEDWSMVLKRGKWCVRGPDGRLHKFASENAAKLYIEEMS